MACPTALSCGHSAEHTPSTPHLLSSASPQAWIPLTQHHVLAGRCSGPLSLHARA